MDQIKLRDLPPFSIRLHPDLRAALMREANINGRTLSGEILRRLQDSLKVDHVSNVVQTGERPGPLLMTGNREKPITDAQRMLLSLFDSMGPDKQLALLTVLRK